MPEPHPSPPSYVGLGWTFTQIFAATLTRAVSSPFRRWAGAGATTYRKDVTFAAIRTMMRTMTIPQSRYLSKGTSWMYHQYCKKNGLEPDDVELEDGRVVGHWFGEHKFGEDGDYAIFFLHGGGFTQAASDAHLPYVHKLVTDMCEKTKKRVSALILAYTLAPEATYPTQLSQAAALLKHLLITEKFPPSRIILAGDSAGGNLALELLSHILHPHPDKSVPEIKLEEPLGGALLYSPWVSFSTEHDSYKRNRESDVLPPSTLRSWASMFLGPSKLDPGVIMGDSYSEPLLADPSWWCGLRNVVDEVLIWAGGGEVFVDGLVAFGKKFERGWTEGGGSKEKARLVVTPRVEHDEPIIGPLLGGKEKSEAQVLIEEWLQQIMKER